jgi:hypothetical protein
VTHLDHSKDLLNKKRKKSEEVKPKKNGKKVESDSEEEVKPKKNGKKVESDSEEEVKPKKNGKKVESDSEEEVKPKKIKKKVESEDESEKPIKKAKIESDSEESATKPTFKSPNGVKVPFKRIDDSIKQTIKTDLRDNSYEGYMSKTGDDFGRLANDKLKITKGRDFKKEKTKFKNKTSFGGINLSTASRSIKLEDDSE